MHVAVDGCFNAVVFCAVRAGGRCYRFGQHVGNCLRRQNDLVGRGPADLRVAG
ncbi:hypothetical protein D3C77_818480 [compost metagenome]